MDPHSFSLLYPDSHLIYVDPDPRGKITTDKVQGSKFFKAGSGSALRKIAGSGSEKNVCKFTALTK